MNKYTAKITDYGITIILVTKTYATFILISVWGESIAAATMPGG